MMQRVEAVIAAVAEMNPRRMVQPAAAAEGHRRGGRQLTAAAFSCELLPPLPVACIVSAAAEVGIGMPRIRRCGVERVA